MGQALYRKYRSKSLDELVGQEHITHTLDEAIKQGRISHAYLFTGPKGVGKTSTARILAHAINGLPYDDDQTHLDIIEIDAASNNSVEDIRDLREKVYVAPSIGKYKVYIIDEVHMLSKAAFNAILKTLEEPPAHAVFILATTEAHKLPETIVSRTQRYVFRPIAVDQAIRHLRTIAAAENIEVTDDALALLAAHGDGSFRDSISLLDQASSLGKRIDAAAVQSLLGIPAIEAIETLRDALTATPVQLSAALQTLYGLYGQGFQAAAIAHELSARLRQSIIDGTLAPETNVLMLLERLLDVPTRRDPDRYLEIVLLGLGAVVSPTSTPVIAQPVSAPAAAKHAKDKAQPPADQPDRTTAGTKPKQPPAQAAAEAAEPTPTETSSPPPVTRQRKAPTTTTSDDDLWPQVLHELKKQYNTLYGIVRMAAVRRTEDGQLELGFAFAFHQKRVNEAKNRQIISDIIERLSGQKMHIICLHDPELKSAKPTSGVDLPPVVAAVVGGDASLTDISNIFGGGELLQS